mmetsp:Transcript_31539/g.84207  ORF Transcript_31539/g.84207 Transcript_31539/m.84207 type:complete len:92 (-) Transcript_31539:274-549(-)
MRTPGRDTRHQVRAEASLDSPARDYLPTETKSHLDFAPKEVPEAPCGQLHFSKKMGKIIPSLPEQHRFSRMMDQTIQSRRLRRRGVYLLHS